MVIGHHDGETELTGARHRFGRRDAAVDREQQPRAGGGELLDARDRDAVAVLEAARQERLDLGAEQPQHLDRERRGAHAVDVVVAVHDDRPPGRDRALDQRAGLRDVAQRERIVQRAVALEERPRRGRIGQPAPHAAPLP